MKKSNLLKKVTSLILIQFCLSSISFPVNQTSAKYTSVKINNIVLFAQSEPLSDKNFMQEYTDDIVKLCNDSSTFHSLSGYINTVSYGQTEVKSYFPQMQDNVIVPYVLSKSASEYVTCEQYALEMIQNINVPEDIPLDGNSDGIVDNIILVVDGKADNMDSPIWAKAFSANGLKINGFNVNRVNIHNSYQLFENVITGGEGVLCHEFMHSLGYPDLYRHNRTGTPVGMWDIMASNSVFLQYPLAYNRAVISGWLDCQEITQDGTYTLSPVSSESGNRLYLLKTPLSDTEFFAVEYRQQGERYSDNPDVKIYGTGLVVYRINTEVDGNYKESNDEIYVFRPNETALDAGEGDLYSSNYGGENAPDTVGSLDWNDDITDGALVYSNGTNSGIKLSNITIDGDSLTFSAEFADTSQADLWKVIDSTVLGSFMPQQLETSSDGTVYILASDNKDISLFCINDTELTAIGTKLGSGSYGSVNQPSLALCNDVPYVLYHDYNYILHLCRYDSLSDKWTEVYKGTELSQYSGIASDGSNLYITYTTGSFPYALHALCYDTETNSFTQIGKNICSNACNMKISVINSSPVIAYRDLNDENKPKIAVFNNDSWEIKTVSDNSCGSLSMVSDGETVYIAPSGNKNTAYKFTGNELTSYNLPDSITENAFMQIPVITDKDCFLAVNTQNPGKLAVYSLNNNKPVGNILATEIVNSLSLTSTGEKIYCSYFTDNGTAIIKYFNLSVNDFIMGDVNADGEFNMTDVVMMQKWLIGSGKLTDWKAGDLYRDNKIDVFDFCQMKYNYLIQSY